MVDSEQQVPGTPFVICPPLWKWTGHLPCKSPKGGPENQSVGGPISMKSGIPLVSPKRPFKYYIIKEVSGWDTPNDYVTT